MATQIVRNGSTITVEIPEEVLQKANLSVGDPVEWSVTANGTLALRVPRESAQPGYEQWAQSEIQAGLNEADAGESLPNEKVIEWLRSWGTSHELPPPL